MERVLCPRVHFKILIFDLELAYIGSANLTGAAFGMKGKDHRNFEVGILTSEADLMACGWASLARPAKEKGFVEIE